MPRYCYTERHRENTEFHGELSQNIRLYPIRLGLVSNSLVSVYVFCFFFFAAGNNTLFKINRYPGELGNSAKSVGGSYTMCW